MSSYQLAYFKFMTQCREHVFFISEHIASSDKWNTWINMFMAIASSSSIAAWVFWQRVSWLWASVIAVSHVIGAIKQYMPFKKRLAVLYPLRNSLDQLCLEIEKDFFHVFNGNLTEQEIHNKTIDYKGKKLAIEQKGLIGTVIPENESYIARAREKNKVYFENFCVGE